MACVRDKLSQFADCGRPPGSVLREEGVLDVWQLQAVGCSLGVVVELGGRERTADAVGMAGWSPGVEGKERVLL